MFLAPFVFMVLTSLMTNDAGADRDLWPHPFQSTNYADVFHKTRCGATRSTLHLRGPGDGFMLLSSVPAAYALARLRWRGRNAVFLVVLVAMMLPPQVTMVPLYIMWAKLHLDGHAVPLILPNCLGDAFSIFLLRQFFLTSRRSTSTRRGSTAAASCAPCCGRRCRWPGRASPPRHCSQFFYAWNDYYGPLLYTSENADNWTLSSGWRRSGPCTMCSGTSPWRRRARHAAGDRAVLPRPARLRRGRHADRSQRMKVAVVGGGSTYTPELVDGFARGATSCVDELVLLDLDAERLEVVGGFARRMLARQGYPGRLDITATSRRRSTGPTSCSSSCGSAARRRGSRTRPCRWRAGASARRRPARAGFAKALRTVPVVLDIADEVGAGRAGRLDHRLHQPGRDRDPRAARRRAPRGRALQRGDRLPALARAGCSASSRSGRSSTRSGSTT